MLPKKTPKTVNKLTSKTITRSRRNRKIPSAPLEIKDQDCKSYLFSMSLEVTLDLKDVKQL